MHRDTKVGLALGVLLVGVVGAFFFRHEGRSQVDVPALDDPIAVDEAIAEKPVVPYLHRGDATPAPPNGGGNAPHWEPPRFLRDDGDEPRANVLLEPLPPVGDRTDRVAPASDGTTPPVDRVSQGARFHVVEAGDTLTGIAAKYLGSTSKYSVLYEANRDVLSSPDRLKLGQKLRIPDPNAPSPNRRARTTPVRVSRPSTPVPEPRALPEPEPTNDPSRETFDLPPTGEASPVSPARRFVPARRSPFTPPANSIRP